MGRIRRLVRAATGRVIGRRILFDQVAVNDVTSVSYDNATTIGLLKCGETNDDELVADGTNIPDAPLFSQVVAIKLQLVYDAASATTLRWVLWRDVDNEGLITSLATQFHSSSDSPAIREINKNIIAKGIFRVPASGLMTNKTVFVRKKTLRRLGSLREGDRIELMVAKAAEGTSGTVSGFGTIYVRVNP